MNLKEECISLFKKYEVIQVNHENPFKLASGKMSPYYFDHRRIFSIPVLRGLVVDLMLEEIENKLDIPLHELCFAGTATAGIAPAYALADACDASFIYVRSQVKGHGMQNLIEGVWEPSRPTIVIDDMVTTGKSLLDAVSELRNRDTRVVAAACITRQNNREVEAAFAEQHLHCVSLFFPEELMA